MGFKIQFFVLQTLSGYLWGVPQLLPIVNAEDKTCPPPTSSPAFCFHLGAPGTWRLCPSSELHQVLRCLAVCSLALPPPWVGLSLVSDSVSAASWFPAMLAGTSILWAWELLQTPDWSPDACGVQCRALPWHSVPCWAPVQRINRATRKSFEALQKINE